MLINTETLDSIDAIEKIIEAGDDAWEPLVNAGIAATEQKDRSVWRIGDLSLLVVKQYGENSIAQFAKEIKCEVGRVREYRTVCGFWDRKNSARAELLECYPNIFYSHFRLAMRLKDMDKAVAFVKECGDNDWIVEAARIVLNERLGKEAPAQKMAEWMGEVVAVNGDEITVTLDRLSAQAFQRGDFCRFVVYEAKRDVATTG